MADPIITVEHLSKRYRISHQGQREQYATLRDVVAAGSKKLLKSFKSRSGSDPIALATHSSIEDFWALKDLSFEVKQGEVIGIIGRNGAGKSTLLKILSRITDPTEGRVTIRGRVASLLEVGTGFHAELTGRENIYLNGAILGMSRVEIKRKFDEIVDFSGVEKFLDTPVKRYSSGMYVRLAFAVAAHLEPEILIVDEVLAVGDMEFQKKCLGKMQDVSTKEGRTVLFVSHHMPSVQRLCSRGLLLQKGQVETSGSISEVLEQYLAGSRGDAQGRRQIEVAEGDCRIVSWHVDNQDGSTSHACISKQTARIHMSIQSKRDIPQAVLGFVIRNLSGDLLVAAHSTDEFQKPIDIPYGLTGIVMTVRLPLKMGMYQVELAVRGANGELLDFWAAEPLLSIIPSHNSSLPPEWHGLVNEPVTFELRG